MQRDKYKLPYIVNLPDDLKRLGLDELPLYYEEMRRFIIESLARASSHLASSLGVVEKKPAKKRASLFVVEAGKFRIASLTVDITSQSSYPMKLPLESK
jgi:hypothetical protein